MKRESFSEVELSGTRRVDFARFALLNNIVTEARTNATGSVLIEKR